MRRLVLLLATMFRLVTISAQRYEGGLDIGTLTTNNWINGYEPDFGYHVTARFHKNRGSHWQNGIRIDVEGINADKRLDSSGAALPAPQDVRFGSPLLAFVLYSNYRYTLGRLYLYGGGSVGLLACSLPDHNSTPYESGKGALFGLQGGAVLWLVRQVGLSAEGAARYHLVSWEFNQNTPHGDRAKESKGFFGFPLMVGLRVGIR